MSNMVEWVLVGLGLVDTFRGRSFYSFNEEERGSLIREKKRKFFVTT
jgi:hypothetical protein